MRFRSLLHLYDTPAMPKAAVEIIVVQINVIQSSPSQNQKEGIKTLNLVKTYHGDALVPFADLARVVGPWKPVSASPSSCI
jgi:hypothetical protein